MRKQINIIPKDYVGNPQDALGYPWSVYVPERDSWTDEQKAASPWGGLKADRQKSIPGDDRIGGFAEYRAAIAELETQGLKVVDPKTSRIPDGAVIEAGVTCMWCGGASALGYRMPETVAEEVVEVELVAQPQNAGEESHETAAIIAMDEGLALMEMDERNKHHPGYCRKCHSWCYGDCEA